MASLGDGIPGMRYQARAVPGHVLTISLFCPSCKIYLVYVFLVACVRDVKLFTPPPSKESIGERGRACGAHSGTMEGPERPAVPDRIPKGA